MGKFVKISVYSSISFIFPSIASYGRHRSNASGDRNCIRSYSNDSRWFSLISKAQISKGFEKTNRFFRRKDEYKAHSLQLVEEIPKWLRYRIFDECYYDDGVHFEKGIEDYEPFGVPYLNHLKSHLEAAYPDLMDLYKKIEKNRADWSQKIKEIMSGHDKPYKPSFEKIIIDKINNSCPTLNRSNDNELGQNNIYIDQSVFNILFKALSNNIQLDPLEVKSSDSTSQLEYAHKTIIAQGDEPYMYKLKDVINDLVKDNDLKKIIQNYSELSDSLRLDADRNDWKSKLMNLYHSVMGGIALEGDGACKLCPSKSNDS